MVHRHQLRQEAGALCLVAEAVDHPGRHVVDRQVGGGRDASGRQFLEDQRRVEARKAAAAELVLYIDAGKAERGGAAQRLDRELLPLVPARGVRQPFVMGEVARGLLERALLVGEGEIHAERLGGATGRRQWGASSLSKAQVFRASRHATLTRKTGRKTVLSRAIALAAIIGLLGGPAVAQKSGGTLKFFHRDSPASMSIHEEATISTVAPTMAGFNNLMG